MATEHEAWIERARSVPIVQEIERRGIMLKRSGSERIGPCPNCGGTDRFSINTIKGVFNCRGCNTGGDVIDLVIFLDHCGFEEACETLTHEPKPNGHDGDGNVHRIKREVAWFPYEDENEELSFQVVKYEPKDFRQRRPDGKGGWTWSTKGLRP